MLVSYRIGLDFEYRILFLYLIVSYRIGFLVLPDGLPRGVSILGPRVAQTRGGDTKWNSGFEKPLVAGVHARRGFFFAKIWTSGFEKPLVTGVHARRGFFFCQKMDF